MEGKRRDLRYCVGMSIGERQSVLYTKATTAHAASFRDFKKINTISDDMDLEIAQNQSSDHHECGPGVTEKVCRREEKRREEKRERFQSARFHR